MHFSDIFKESFLEGFSTVELTPKTIVLAFVIASVFALYIFFVYKFVTRKEFYDKTFNVSLFVTGSNSTLLSGELATLLTGRTVEFEILPFSFYEMKLYYELNNKSFRDDLFMDYLKWGGFPVRFDFSDDSSVHKYLSNLYESIVNRDIVGKTNSFLVL